MNNDAFNNSPVVKEIERKQAKRSMMLFWICFICMVVAIAGAVITKGKMSNQKFEGIKEVEVSVIDVLEKEVRINGSYHTTYEVTVEYMGEEYELIDAASYPWTSYGYSGTAYMYEGNIYVNENGPSTRTGVGKLYSVFLITSLAFVILTPCMLSSALQRRKRALEK